MDLAGGDRDRIVGDRQRHRLAGAGFNPCAIDLSVDGADGLAAARHYQPSWPRLQAEFDRLPLSSASVDAVIYNGSLHYSADYRQTLAEALRVLKPRGRLYVLDSPLYRDVQSGQDMLREREAAFERDYGDRSNHLPSLGFLTWGGLAELAASLGLSWRFARPWYGWRWAARGLIAQLKGQREPAKFLLCWTEKR